MSQPGPVTYQPAIGDEGWYIVRDHFRIRAKVIDFWDRHTVRLRHATGTDEYLSVFVRPPLSHPGGLGGRWFEPDAVFGPDGVGDHEPPPQVAPRRTTAVVTKSQLDDEIVSECSFTAAEAVGAIGDVPFMDGLDRVTICILETRNGTKLVGVNYGAIDPSRHEPERGIREARQAALDQLWPMLGYELRSRLAASGSKP